jgi:glycosyltransferase involved in cell wall biosynthesis
VATPLRILQTCFSPSWGGLELQALEVARQLARRNHRVWLACLPGSRLQREASSEKIPTLAFPVTGYLHPSVVLALRRFITEERPDIIHCQASRDIATVVPAMRLSMKRTPVLLSKRVGSYIDKRDLFHRFTYSNLSRVLAISSVIRRNVIETTPIPPERVITLFDAVDTEIFSLGRADGQSVRREFGYDQETVLVGFVGRFSPGKGHEELLQAAKTITPAHPGVRFLVVGEASFGEQAYERHIRSSAHAMGLDGVLTFTGFRKDIPEVMAAFDILAFPSHAESFGVVLIEAMAMERPVVSTNCDGVLDIVAEGVTGIYVHPRNAAELAAGLTRLIENPELRRTMGKAGRQRVLERFDQQRQIDELERLYHEVLRERTAPPTISTSEDPPGR